MSQIGPSLPAHLAKRKRTPDEDGDGDNDRRVRHASPASFGPAMPPTGPAQPSHGPSLPPGFATKNEDEIALDDDESDDEAVGPALPATAKPARPSQGPTMGPAMPPPNIRGLGEADEDKQSETVHHQNHNTSDHSDPDSDDSDYGPALPKAGDQARASELDDNSLEEESAAFDPSAAAPSLRDDWMLAPPSDNSIAALAADPTKIRSRKFATGRAAAAGQARAGSGGAGSAIGSLWTETLEQKQKRLADTVLGRAADPRQGGDAESQGPSTSAALAAANAARNAQIKAYTEATRGKSLYEQHQSSLKGDVSTRDRKGHSSRAEKHEKRDKEDREETRHRGQDHDRHDRNDRDRRRDRHRYDERDSRKDGGDRDSRDRDGRDRNETTERRSGRDERSDRDGRDDRDDRDKRHRRDREDRDRRHDREDRHSRHGRHSRHDRHDRDSRAGSKSKKAEEEDDPSARAFDRDKDMNIGAQFNDKQRRELVTRSSDFGGRFSKGNFL
ncbi:hypothetical protein F503_05184 [Ophiostoma piceae UAMH 11346]|uniref:DUF3752 domain-containing protein n=1 Tax=Ophiostoma piceae (strain UAMH 11346) TaxID=1262450 RepID=S3C9A4_OPHP1|nr:hypothetical protein F503_05184 [Ophiostoma piceae UAMH 11346]